MFKSWSSFSTLTTHSCVLMYKTYRTCWLLNKRLRFMPLEIKSTNSLVTMGMTMGWVCTVSVTEVAASDLTADCRPEGNWGWMLAILSGQNLCKGRFCGLDLAFFVGSGLLASNIGCRILLLALINLRNTVHKVIRLCMWNDSI